MNFPHRKYSNCAICRFGTSPWSVPTIQVFPKRFLHAWSPTALPKKTKRKTKKSSPATDCPTTWTGEKFPAPVVRRRGGIPRHKTNRNVIWDRWKTSELKSVYQESNSRQRHNLSIFRPTIFSRQEPFQRPRSRSVEINRGVVSNKSIIEFIWDEQENVAKTITADELALWHVQSHWQFTQLHRAVRDRIRQGCKKGMKDSSDPLFHQLKAAFLKTGLRGVRAELKYLFQKAALDIEKVPFSALRDIVNFSHPPEWYPATRKLQRKIHLHVGPTNSGKTYHALKKLEAAESGFYAGPLRLLAQEVYTRMIAKGKICSLVTGEERIIQAEPTSGICSCTVEMLPVDIKVDVAVIDEIQMIADPDRGWAWTNAFLGVQANEVHVCGEMRTVALIEKLCRLTGESLEVHTYNRLTPLHHMNSSLKGDMTNLQKGDCIIAFSRVALHLIKKEVEKKTGRRCAIVYGSLPPETRTQQSALFNDPDNEYDFLAASDAVGMGLNLSIKRIVFYETQKFDGFVVRSIQTSELKQIAGRAGRFRTAAQDNVNNDHPKTGSSSHPKSVSKNTAGLVTSFEDFDLPLVKRAMNAEAPLLAAAAILPSDEAIIRFASYYPTQTPLSFILRRMAELSTTSSTFFFSSLKVVIETADCIQTVKMTLRDRLKFITAPSSIQETSGIVRTFAECVANNKSGNILDIPEVQLEAMDTPAFADRSQLARLEALHKTITLYLWLSWRFPQVFTSQALAFHISSLCEEKITACLGHIEQTKTQMKRAANTRRMKALEHDLLARNLETSIGQQSMETQFSKSDEQNQLEEGQTQTDPRVIPSLLPLPWKARINPEPKQAWTNV